MKKILFIALAHSSHTVSWVRLFENSPFEIYTFGIANTETNQLKNVFSYKYYYRSKNKSKIIRAIKKVNQHTFGLSIVNDLGEADYLKAIIRKTKPDIIHTLGFDPAGYQFLKIVDECKSYANFKWVHTSRGSELSLQGFLPAEANKEVLNKCDFFIADNEVHYSIAVEYGLQRTKIPSFGIVPGSGGIDLQLFKSMASPLPASKRERIIVWPKAYECPFSKALPVFEAFKLAWDQIKPCRIIMTAMIPETQMWFNTLPEEIKDSSTQHERVDHSDLLKLLSSARVLLAPTLSDGIPNSLYEAMGMGVLPIVSPLLTYSDSLKDKVNVIYARNLYPAEIADALLIAMNDDKLVDSITMSNYTIVEKMANRDTIKTQMIALYQKLLS